MNRLFSDVTRLRRTCPWFQSLTLEALRVYLAEETQEVLGALDDQNPDSLKEELGDLLFQIILYCQLASEYGWFSIWDVIDSLHRKIVRRNPHVFGSLKLKDIEAVNHHWQWVKAGEKNKMHSGERYQIQMDGGHATVFLREGCSVSFPIIPPPAIKFTSGYTLSAWIWSALNNALETAKLSISDSEMKEIAAWISQHAAGVPQ